MDILIGILANCIYGTIIKATGIIGSKVKIKSYKKSLEKEITQKFHLNDDNINTSNLEKFFSISQIKDLISDFVVFEATKSQRISSKYTSKKNESLLSKSEFIKLLSRKYITIYDCDQADTLILEECFAFIFSFCEEKVYSSLKKSDKATLYFINTHTEKYYNYLDKKLIDLNDKINRLLDRDLETPNKNYDEIKNKYDKILKSRYSEAHIYLLDKFSFDAFYVPPTLLVSPQNDTRTSEVSYNSEYVAQLEWDSVFIKNNIIYVVGGAGYGKSLFLRKIVNDYHNLYINDTDEYLVVLGELKMFFPNGLDTPIPVDQFILDSIKINTLMGDVNIDFVHHYLNMGRCIILLDALDEVEKNKRNDLHEKIIAYFKNQNPNNKICLTSRDRGFIPEKNIEVYHISPLNHKEIEQYVDNIIKLGKFDKSDKAPFMQQTTVLIDKGFLNSFLVLSLLLNIYKAERELPENKLDLYSKCFEYITVKREKEKTKDRFDWKNISLLMKDNTFMELSQLCYPNNKDIEKNVIINELTKIYKSKYSNENETINAIEEFLRFCSDRTELFVPSSTDDKFKFFHRSFFEYFYSLNLFVNYINPQDLIEKFKVFDVDSEVFELTMSMLKQRAESKYQDVLEVIFTKSESELKNSEEFIIFNILILIMQIVDDVQYKERFFNLIINYKDIIVKNIRNIYNLNIVTILLNDFNNYKAKICEVYYKESLFVLLDTLSIILKLNNSNDSVLLDEVTDEEDRLFYYNNRLFYFQRRNSLFYFELFIKHTDVKELLNSLDTKKLKSLGISNKKLIKALKDFKSKNIEIQSTMLKHIL